MSHCPGAGHVAGGDRKVTFSGESPIKEFGAKERAKAMATARITADQLDPHYCLTRNRLVRSTATDISA